MDSNCSKYAIVAKNDKNLDDARVLVKVLYVRNVRSQQSIPSERTRSLSVFECVNLLLYMCSSTIIYSNFAVAMFPCAPGS